MPGRLHAISLLFAVGCTGPASVAHDDTGTAPAPPSASSFSVTLPQGTASAAAPALAAYPGMVGLYNGDDDDGDGEEDFEQAGADGDDDLATFTLTPAGTALTLTLTGDDENVRIWHDGEVFMDDGLDELTLEATTTPLTLAVEFGDYLASATLTITDGTDTLDLALTAAPLLLSHHLLPAENVWVVDVNYPNWGYSNQDMIAVFEDVLGDAFIPVPGGDYDVDVWVQDELQFATSTAPGLRIDTAIDSIRDRGLDNMPEDMLEGPGMMVRTWGSTWSASTYDSFGNLEVSPPVSVAGTDYPFGRIYYGARGNARPTSDLTDFLAAQSVQAPVEIDTSWLCVGHVDEFSTFIPDPSSEKGFRFVFADTAAGYAMLSAADGDTALSRYASGHRVDSIDELRSDTGLQRLNEDIQADYLDPILETFVNEFGLTESDIIRIPALFEEYSGCAVALIPGTVNMTVVTMADEPTKLFLPDPFLREDDAPQSDDPLITEVEALFPDDLELYFVDDWDVYHMGFGEVHCGSNVRRTPEEGWWNHPALLPDG